MPEQRITVIMPAHDEARFIAAAVASVHVQTHRPVELIVIDDGSTDATAELALATAGPVPVRVLSHATPSGSIAARNWGLAEASTEWIAMLDADDIWDPRKLERQCETLDASSEETPICVLGTKGRHINEAGDDIGAYDPGGCTTEAEYRAVIAAGAIPLVGHSSVLFRRQDALDAGGYAEDALCAEDQDLWDRIAALRDELILTVDEPLYYYRKKRGGMMQRDFWPQQVNFRRVVANRDRRHHGQPPLSLEEFRRQQRARPVWARARERIDDYGTWLYRFGAMNVVNGRRAVGGAQLAAAAVLRPRRVAAGIRRRLR